MHSYPHPDCQQHVPSFTRSFISTSTMYLKAIQAFKLQQTSKLLKINSDLMCFITSFTDRVANLSFTLSRHLNAALE